ncbi:MAG: sigma 54-interacting transcriptional regulator [Thermodesulfobacteriota bacterium]
MVADENEYFRQATIRICSTLDIEVALQHCLQYLSSFIPISQITLSLYEPVAGHMQALAAVTYDKIKRPHDPLRLPREAMANIESDHAKAQNGILILNRAGLQPGARAVLQLLGGPLDKSLLIMFLPIVSRGYGLLVLTASGWDRYTETHAHLLSLLREPFTIAISNVLKHQELLKLKDMLDAENRELSRNLVRSSDGEIIGKDLGLKHVMEMVSQVACLDNPVMLLGETGVGKEIIANAIHFSSLRKDKPFIKVNCGAIADGFLDSELFGHEKGAFTSAIAQKRGRFERAHTGSIFLDEIGELSSAAQVKLLRVVQQKEIERIGGSKPIPVDVRIITATHRNIEEMICAGQFREDLWFRLNIFPIIIPPLRHRKEDIPALVHYFVQKKSREMKFHTPPPVTAESMEQLKAHHWPGNIRELENVVERALIQHRGLNEDVSLNFDYFVFSDQRSKSRLSSNPADEILPLDEAIAKHIQEALNITNKKVHGADGAAHLLRVNPNTLRSKMKKLGISSSRKSWNRLSCHK